MTKPFHMLTPAEKTALRISQNRAINERIADDKTKVKKPPTASTAEFTRTTPGERGGVIRKVQS